MATNSTSFAYASPADIREAHDFRQCGDLVNDDGTRVTDAAQFDANSKVLKCLMKGAFLIESSCLKGNKYSVEDLQSLAGAARAGIIDLNVEIAWWKLNVRRFSKMDIPPECMLAFSQLDDLASGAMIFGLVAQADAGNPSNGFMTQAEWQTLNPAVVQSSRYWGCRAYRNVPGSGAGNGSCCDGD
jgi:hypothetical protein